MFLSRLLISIERNYWLIKLEIAKLIWIIKKMKHLIQSLKKSMIIQTNNVIIMNICKQTSIINTNWISRMNLRLIKTSQFFNQFSNLEIRHKSEKYHLISDVLSRLQSLNKENTSNNHVELDELFAEHAVYAYNIILIEINSDFRQRIINEYFKNEAWKKIIQIIN